MSDIQRYELKSVLVMFDGKLQSMIYKKDHIKAINAKDKIIKDRERANDAQSAELKRLWNVEKAQAKKIDMIKKALDVLANKCLNQDNNFAESLALKSFANHVKELTK